MSWMSCRLRQALATGHEEAQATATGQEKKSAAAGDNEQAIAETSSSGIGKGQLKDMPRLLFIAIIIAASSELSWEASCPCGATGSENKALANENSVRR